MTMIIGLGHRKGVGKETLARILVEEHGFVRLAFADALKEVLTAMSPYLDPALADAIAKLGIEEAKRSPAPVRDALNMLGNTMRAHVSPEVWVLAVTRRIDASAGGRFVISDVRYQNEVRAIRDRGGRVFRVDRQCAAVSYDDSDDALEGFDQWDGVVDNGGSIDDLAAQAAALVDTIQCSMAS